MTKRDVIGRAIGEETVWGVCPFDGLSLHACRALERLPREAKSVLVMLFPYRFEDGGERNLSRYACVPDYHTVVGAELRGVADRLAREFSPYRFEAFTDNSPLPEVYAAAVAGLGCIGDHGLLIHPTFGSYVFIGTIVTDMPIECKPLSDAPLCSHCGACAAACPSDHIRYKGNQCLSDITQKKGELTEEEQRLMKQNGLVWGCDRCQEACPHNQTAVIRPHPCFTAYEPMLLPPLPTDWKQKAYGWRGRAVLERNLKILGYVSDENSGH